MHFSGLSTLTFVAFLVLPPSLALPLELPCPSQPEHESDATQPQPRFFPLEHFLSSIHSQSFPRAISVYSDASATSVYSGLSSAPTSSPPSLALPIVLPLLGTLLVILMLAAIKLIYVKQRRLTTIHHFPQLLSDLEDADYLEMEECGSRSISVDEGHSKRGDNKGDKDGVETTTIDISLVPAAGGVDTRLKHSNDSATRAHSQLEGPRQNDNTRSDASHSSQSRYLNPSLALESLSRPGNGNNGFLVGLLGSPDWETTMARTVADHQWRVHREAKAGERERALASATAASIAKKTSILGQASTCDAVSMSRHSNLEQRRQTWMSSVYSSQRSQRSTRHWDGASDAHGNESTSGASVTASRRSSTYSYHTSSRIHPYKQKRKVACQHDGLPFPPMPMPTVTSMGEIQHFATPSRPANPSPRTSARRGGRRALDLQMGRAEEERPRSFASTVDGTNVLGSSPSSRSNLALASDYRAWTMGGSDSSHPTLRASNSARNESYRFQFCVEDFSGSDISQKRLGYSNGSIAPSQSAPERSQLATPPTSNAFVRLEPLTPLSAAVLSPSSVTESPEMPGAYHSLTPASRSHNATASAANAASRRERIRNGSRMRIGEVRVNMARVEPRFIDLGLESVTADSDSKAIGIGAFGLGLTFGFLKRNKSPPLAHSEVDEYASESPTKSKANSGWKGGLYNLPPLASLSSLDLPSLQVPSLTSSPISPDSPCGFPLSPSLQSSLEGSPVIASSSGGHSPRMMEQRPRNWRHERVMGHVPFSLIPPPPSPPSLVIGSPVSIPNSGYSSPASPNPVAPWITIESAAGSKDSLDLVLPGSFDSGARSTHSHEQVAGQGQGILSRFKSLNALSLAGFGGQTVPLRPSPLRRVMSLRSFRSLGSGSPESQRSTKSGTHGKAESVRSTGTSLSKADMSTGKEKVEKSFRSVRSKLSQEQSIIAPQADDSVEMSQILNGLEQDHSATSLNLLLQSLELPAASFTLAARDDASTAASALTVTSEDHDLSAPVWPFDLELSLSPSTIPGGSLGKEREGRSTRVHSGLPESVRTDDEPGAWAVRSPLMSSPSPTGSPRAISAEEKTLKESTLGPDNRLAVVKEESVRRSSSETVRPLAMFSTTALPTTSSTTMEIPTRSAASSMYATAAVLAEYANPIPALDPQFVTTSTAASTSEAVSTTSSFNSRSRSFFRRPLASQRTTGPTNELCEVSELGEMEEGDWRKTVLTYTSIASGENLSDVEYITQMHSKQFGH